MSSFYTIQIISLAISFEIALSMFFILIICIKFLSILFASNISLSPFSAILSSLHFYLIYFSMPLMQFYSFKANFNDLFSNRLSFIVYQLIVHFCLIMSIKSFL